MQGQQLPHPQPGERGGEKDGCVLFGRRGTDEGEDLLRQEDVDVFAPALGNFSTSAAAFVGRRYSFRARSRIPCSWIKSLFRVRTEPPKPASQRSISSVVTASMGISPNAGNRWAWIVER
jgi:hypothetical protein